MMKRFDAQDLQMMTGAHGVLKVLGRTNITLLDILLRETIQNSLDAASDSSDGYVECHVDMVDFDKHETLRKRLEFLKQDPADSYFERLCSRMQDNFPAILLLSDKGTTGLSGPVIRNDDFNSNSERKNFYNLVYQLGETHGQAGSGGSYGFGKTIFYQLSRSGLVMFYSRSGEGERLAFCSICPEECENGSKGISWWGNTYNYKNLLFTAPVEDPVFIELILEKLEIPHKRFDENETGTLVGIIAPDLNRLTNGADSENNSGVPNGMEDDNIFRLFEEKVISTVQKWYWPRMTETDLVNPVGGIKPLKFFYNGQEKHLSTEYDEMGSLLRAAEKSNLGQNSDQDVCTKQIDHRNGNILVGTLAYQIVNGYSNLSHLNRIKMIRKPRMVVFEREVSTPPNKSVAAVFLVNSEQEVYPNKNKIDSEKTILDNAFRECEAATHSEWNYQSLPPRYEWFKSYVKKAVEQTKKEIQELMNPTNAEGFKSAGLANIAKKLGRLLQTEEEGGMTTFTVPDGRYDNRSGKGNSRKPRLNVISYDVPDNMTVQFCLSAPNLKAGVYKVSLLADGVSGALDKENWESILGMDFPFKLAEFSIENTNVSHEIGDGFLKLELHDKIENLEFNINVETIKKDARITFDIKQLQ